MYIDTRMDCFPFSFPLSLSLWIWIVIGIMNYTQIKLLLDGRVVWWVLVKYKMYHSVEMSRIL